jgi:hypothetical protein
MVTMADIRALMEDGPELPSQLAEWLEMELAPLVLLLDRMQIPGCARCSRRFLPSVRSRARYCSRECEESDTGPGPVPTGRPERGATPLRRGTAPTGQVSRSDRRDQPELDLYSWKTLVRCEKRWDAIASTLKANVDVALTLYRDGSWAA